MNVKMEDLVVYQLAIEIGDDVYKMVIAWPFLIKILWENKLFVLQTPSL